VQLALGKLPQEITQLESSADLYAEEYAGDADLQALTDRASSLNKSYDMIDRNFAKSSYFDSDPINFS
jgi:hypothetical protein